MKYRVWNSFQYGFPPSPPFLGIGMLTCIATQARSEDVAFQSSKVHLTSTALSNSNTSCVAFLAQPSWWAFTIPDSQWLAKKIIHFNIEHPIHSTWHPTLSTRALSTKSTNPSSSSCKISKALAVISAKVGSLVVWSSKSNLIHQSVNQGWLCSQQPVAQLIVSKEAKDIFSVRCIHSR